MILLKCFFLRTCIWEKYMVANETLLCVIFMIMGTRDSAIMSHNLYKGILEIIIFFSPTCLALCLSKLLIKTLMRSSYDRFQA